MHVEPRSPRAYPWYLAPFFWNQRRKYGRELEAARLWARVPRLFAAIALLYGALDRKGSPLDPALRSLLTVRISQLNWCLFCVDINPATLLKRGASPEKVEALPHWRDSPLFDARERVALDYAEAITRGDRQVDDALMTAVKARFDDDALVELTALIAFQNLSSKFNAALGVPAQGFCRLPGAARAEGPEVP
jgi:AhpD family alkylhydroperoxidase